MKKINISKAKAELRKYIKIARTGEDIMIFDRNQIVAKLVAVLPETDIQIIAATVSLRDTLAKLEDRPFTETRDIVDLLDADREDRR